MRSHPSATHPMLTESDQRICSLKCCGQGPSLTALHPSPGTVTTASVTVRPRYASAVSFILLRINALTSSALNCFGWPSTLTCGMWVATVQAVQGERMSRSRSGLAGHPTQV